VATDGLSWLQFAYWVAPGESRKFPTTNKISSKVMLHPSTNHGSVEAAGGNGRPVWPSCSPEKVIWMVAGLLGAPWVNPGLQVVFKVLPAAGAQLGSKPALTFVLLFPPQAHAASMSRIA
jgi:hypothetical protein